MLVDKKPLNQLKTFIYIIKTNVRGKRDYSFKNPWKK